MTPRPATSCGSVRYYEVSGLDTLQDDYLASARDDYGDYFGVNPKFDSEPFKLEARIQRLRYFNKRN